MFPFAKDGAVAVGASPRVAIGPLVGAEPDGTAVAFAPLAGLDQAKRGDR